MRWIYRSDVVFFFDSIVKKGGDTGYLLAEKRNAECYGAGTSLQYRSLASGRAFAVTCMCFIDLNIIPLRAYTYNMHALLKRQELA